MWLRIDDNDKRPSKLINLDKIVSIETRIATSGAMNGFCCAFARYDATAGYECSAKHGDVFLAWFKDINESECFIDELRNSIETGCKMESLFSLVYRAKREYRKICG